MRRLKKTMIVRARCWRSLWRLAPMVLHAGQQVSYFEWESFGLLGTAECCLCGRSHTVTVHKARVVE